MFFSMPKAWLALLLLLSFSAAGNGEKVNELPKPVVKDGKVSAEGAKSMVFDRTDKGVKIKTLDKPKEKKPFEAFAGLKAAAAAAVVKASESRFIDFAGRIDGMMITVDEPKKSDVADQLVLNVPEGPRTTPDQFRILIEGNLKLGGGKGRGSASQDQHWTSLVGNISIDMKNVNPIFNRNIGAGRFGTLNTVMPINSLRKDSDGDVAEIMIKARPGSKFDVLSLMAALGTGGATRIVQFKDEPGKTKITVEVGTSGEVRIPVTLVRRKEGEPRKGFGVGVGTVPFYVSAVGGTFRKTVSLGVFEIVAKVEEPEKDIRQTVLASDYVGDAWKKHRTRRPNPNIIRDYQGLRPGGKGFAIRHRKAPGFVSKSPCLPGGPRSTNLNTPAELKSGAFRVTSRTAGVKHSACGYVFVRNPVDLQLVSGHNIPVVTVVRMRYALTLTASPAYWTGTKDNTIREATLVWNQGFDANATMADAEDVTILELTGGAIYKLSLGKVISVLFNKRRGLVWAFIKKVAGDQIKKQVDNVAAYIYGEKENAGASAGFMLDARWQRVDKNGNVDFFDEDGQGVSGKHGVNDIGKEPKEFEMNMFEKDLPGTNVLNPDAELTNGIQITPPLIGGMQTTGSKPVMHVNSTVFATRSAEDGNEKPKSYAEITLKVKKPDTVVTSLITR